MKPPKSIRNIVQTLLGKKNKSSSKGSGQFDDDIKPTTSLDNSGRHHRSADDLLHDGTTDFNSNRLPRVSVGSRSRSLPRRSQSCMNVRPSLSRQPEKIYGIQVVNGLNEEYQFERNQFDFKPGSRTRSSASNPRSISSNATSDSYNRSDFSKRSASNTTEFEVDEGYGDTLPRTTSWSHPVSRNSRTVSFDFPGQTQSAKQTRKLKAPENFPSNNKNRFASQENLSSDFQQPRRPAARTSRDITEEKLRTCLHVLDRLSAQVKEIKDVSKRVQYVDTKVKVGNMERGERERRLRELDMAAAASQRLKSLLKSGVEDLPSTRLSSRSSGYDSENSTCSRRTSASPEQEEAQRTSRPSGRRTQPQRSFAGGQGAMYHSTQPYPQSVSDMMPIWDAKDMTAHSKRAPGPLMTREDSMSSGYATGSSSEDGKNDSPNATDADSVASAYSRQGEHPQFYRRQEATKAWNQQHFHHFQQQQQQLGYAHEAYDPYAVYGTYQHHAPNNENIYGNYADLYGYAPSSVYEQEIYSNGWYQLPSATQTGAQHYNNQDTTTVLPAATAYSHGWSQISYAPQPQSTKYGGLSDLFYDPTAQSDPSLIESIAKEVALDSQSAEESTWKSYGSFRYRNGQRTITAPTNRKRKTVRFSQTVRQRVETEESEMEDSTSVIKGGADETESEGGKDAGVGINQGDFGDSSEIYMWPRQQQAGLVKDGPQDTASGNQQKALPEPIYEFPSGHIESSCMCGDCILARGSCQMQPTQAVSYY